MKRITLRLMGVAMVVAGAGVIAGSNDRTSVAGPTMCGIFVATTGTNSIGCGLDTTTPCQTIAFGLTRAAMEGVTCVFVQAGIYDEVVSLVSGIHIQGGYNTRWQFDSYTLPSHAARLRGGLDGGTSQFLTIRAVSLTSPTRISNLIIQGPNVPAVNTGKSSYAVYASNANRLALMDVQIEGGNGGPGAAGTNGTDAPASGINGATGQDGLDAGGCDSSTRGLGGPGASNNCSGTNVSGGNGGLGGTADTSCPFTLTPTAGLNGNTGAGPGAGTFGTGGGVCLNGNNGSNGTAGSNGMGGSGASSGIVSGGFWVSNFGASGTIGNHGGGGGGGGGAGGCNTGGNFYGAGGGGGGAGGCRGSGATGGGGAGGSFGVFANNSVVDLSNVEIIRGIGGAGGPGGIGGRGQPGGIGGNGGETGAGISNGGRGGNGGNGGHGGGGGGGAGGPSVGVYCNGSSIAQLGVTVSGGSGGSGGAGGVSAPGGHLPAGNSGTSGVAGSIQSIANCSSTSFASIAACDATPCVTGGPPACVADIAPDRGDGLVGVPDLLKIINSWGPCPE